MGRYVIGRLLWTVLVVLIVTLLTFVIFFVMPPGNPAVRFAGKQPTPELIAEVETQPRARQVAARAVRALREAALHGRRRTARPASAAAAGRASASRTTAARRSARRSSTGRRERFRSSSAPRSSGSSWASRSGSLSALKRRSVWDRVAMGFALFGISAPVFWLGLVVALHLLEDARDRGLETGYVEFSEDPSGWFTPPDPAVDRPRAPLRGLLRADDAREPDRRDGRGLHPHGARQGALRAEGRLQARPPREPDADRHHASGWTSRSSWAARSSRRRSSTSRASATTPCRRRRAPTSRRSRASSSWPRSPSRS